MVDRSVEVVLRAKVSDFNRDISSSATTTDRLNASLSKADASSSRLGSTSRKTAKDVDQVGESARRSGLEIDKLSDRVKLYAQAAVTAGPGLLPVISLAAPAVAGLSVGLAAAALGGVSLVAALQGVGEATKAVDAYNLDPTVESYEAAREALDALSPAAQQFVSDFQEFQPVLTSLRDASAEGWMPGLSDSLDNLTTLAPKARDLLLDVSRAGGNALEDSTASLASGRWEEFYDLIDRQAPQTITALTEIVGDLSHGVAGLMVSSEEGANGFIGWTGEVADNFDRWSNSAQGREDVQAFLDYASTNGPKVQEFFGSLVDTVAQIAQAAAPLGGATLTALTAVSDVIGTIADSPVGTPLLAAAAGLSVFNRAAKLTAGLGASKFLTKTFPVGLRATGTEARAGVPRLRDFGNALVFAAHSNDTLTKAQRSGSKVSAASATNALRAREAVMGWGKGAATAAVPIAALALTATGAADGMGISNTAAGALIGTLGGPWGMAIGAAAGGVLDLSSALTGDLTSALQQAQAATASGNLPQMRAELVDLRAEIDDTSAAGGFFSDAMHGLSLGKIDGITAARDEVVLLDDAIRKTQETSVRGFGTEGNGLNLLTQGLEMTAEQYDRARLAGANFYDMVGSAGKVLDRRGQWRAYQEAIDGASAALETNGKTLDNNVAAGRANNDALDRMGASALTFAQNLKGADRTDFLRNARNGIQGAAVDFGLGQAAARRLANQIIGVGNLKAKPGVGLDDSGFKQGQGRVKKGLGAMNGSSADPWVDLYDDPFQQGMSRTKAGVRALNAARANPVVNLNDQATGRARGIQAVIDSITGTTVYITTVHRDVRVAAPQGVSANPTHNADGGYITGPGGPRDDLIPAMLSNGEFVVNAAATRNNLGLLHELNAQRYANGGLAERVEDYKRRLQPSSFFANGGQVREGAERYRDGRRPGPSGPAPAVDPTTAAALRTVAAILGPIQKSFDRSLDKVEKQGKRALQRADNPKERREALRDLQRDRVEVFRDRVKKAADALKRETEERNDLIGSMKDYSSTVASAYQHDLFGNGLAGFQLQADADTNDANTAFAALQTAMANGLDGALLDALRESGDVNTITQFGALDAAQIAIEEARFAARGAATGRIGDQAGLQRYGAAIDTQNMILSRLDHNLDRFSDRLDRLGDQVRAGARSGTRQGAAEHSKGRDRATTQGVRAQGRGGGGRAGGRRGGRRG